MRPAPSLRTSKARVPTGHTTLLLFMHALVACSNTISTLRSRSLRVGGLSATEKPVNIGKGALLSFVFISALKKHHTTQCALYQDDTHYSDMGSFKKEGEKLWKKTMYVV